MSHQIFVDKMLFVLCTPMVFLAESSFVIARSKGRLRTGPSISDEMVPSIVAEDGIALRVYCLLADGPQNVVEASANSLWQGGWRRTHSVKGGLPK